MHLNNNRTILVVIIRNLTVRLKCEKEASSV